MSGTVTETVGLSVVVPAHHEDRRPGPTLHCGLLAVGLALLPLVPAPLKAQGRDPVPEFITAGLWKPYVRDGECLVPVPLPDPGNAEALHWQTTARFGFRLPGGYFNGPYGHDRVGIYDASPAPPPTCCGT